MAKKHYYNQIARFDGKNCFLEVMNNGFALGKGKVLLNFVQYDTSVGAGDRIVANIDIYMDLQKAAYLCEEIKSGQFAKMVRDAKKVGKFKNQTVNDYTVYFVDMGGKTPERAARPDGLALSRQFKIQTGSRMPWVLRAEVGPGEVNETGLIVPKGKCEKYINIALTDEDFKALAVMLDKHIQAYINHVYQSHSDRFYPREEINIFTPDKKEK